MGAALLLCCGGRWCAQAWCEAWRVRGGCRAPGAADLGDLRVLEVSMELELRVGCVPPTLPTAGQRGSGLFPSSFLEPGEAVSIPASIC